MMQMARWMKKTAMPIWFRKSLMSVLFVALVLSGVRL
jgi:hypothetical protein